MFRILSAVAKGAVVVLVAVVAGPFVLPACWAATQDTAAANGSAWLTQKRSVVDGSWGVTDADKYVQTSEAVIALGALNKNGAAYYGGVAWLGNHAPGNVDFAARRILALGAANHAVTADLTLLQLAQALAAPGNNGWGLSQTYQGSALDTALSLQALNQQGVTGNVALAVAYLVGSQLTGSDSGWALGQETVSDPVTTAQVVIALVPQNALGGVSAAITKGLAALNAKVTASSPTPQLALAIVANLRNDPNSAQATTLLNGLLGRQTADGSWDADPYSTALALRAVAAGAGKDLAAQKLAVNMPDDALRAAVNATLGQGAMDRITAGQLLLLTSLNASGLGIADLTGLQGARNLRTLDVSKNNISSFTPIAGLNITSLNESGNPGYKPPPPPPGNGVGDVPTLPEWGSLLLATTLLFLSLRTRPRA